MNNEYTYLEELTEIYSEIHKDVHGVRARWATFNSEEQAKQAIDRLCAQLQEQQEYEEQQFQLLQERAAYESRMGTDCSWIAANKYEALAGEPQ